MWVIGVSVWWCDKNSTRDENSDKVGWGTLQLLRFWVRKSEGFRVRIVRAIGAVCVRLWHGLLSFRLFGVENFLLARLGRGRHLFRDWDTPRGIITGAWYYTSTSSETGGRGAGAGKAGGNKKVNLSPKPPKSPKSPSKHVRYVILKYQSR